MAGRARKLSAPRVLRASSTPIGFHSFDSMRSGDRCLFCWRRGRLLGSMKRGDEPKLDENATPGIADGLAASAEELDEMLVDIDPADSFDPEEF